MMILIQLVMGDVRNRVYFDLWLPQTHSLVSGGVS